MADAWIAYQSEDGSDYREIDPATPEYVVRPGDGALSAEAIYTDQHAYDEGYESAAATSIGTAAERTPRYERLQAINEGRDRTDGGHSRRMSELEKRRITQAICNYLEVTPYQTDEAVRIMTLLNLDRFGNQKRIEKVALAVVRYVVHKDRFEHRRDPEARRITEQPAFGEVMDTHDVRMRDVMRVSQMMKERLKLHQERHPTRSIIPGPDPNLRAAQRSARANGE